MPDKFQHKENHGSAFKNNKKDVVTKPDYTGEINIKGELFWLNIWENKKENGPKFNVTVNPKNEGQ